MTETLLIPLTTRRGLVCAHAVIDAADEAMLAYRWFLCNGYVMRFVRLPDGGRVRPRLHRELLGLAPGNPLQVDHINRDPLDNRRSNLRIVTPALNAQNKGSLDGSSSRFRGVTWDVKRRKWSAQVKLAGVNHNLGRFDREEEAAAAAAAFRRDYLPGAVEEAVS